MKKEVASFIRRIIAYAIDLFIINTLILRPFNLYSTTKFGFAFSRELMIVGVSVSILTLLYWALLEYTVKQSIGKMITRIYVSSTIKKQELTLTQCLLRNVTKIISIVLVLDVLYALINKTHQRYFEKISNTEVLKIKEKK